MENCKNICLNEEQTYKLYKCKFSLILFYLIHMHDACKLSSKHFFNTEQLPEQMCDSQHTKTKEIHSKKQVNVFLAKKLKR